MDNLLEAVQEQATKSILQCRMVEEFPDLPDAGETMDKMKKEYEKVDIKEELKEQQEKAREQIKEKFDEAQQFMKDSINNVMDQCKQAVEEVKADLKDLGVSAGCLIVATAEFITRIALVPVAIIGVAPLGPAILSNLIPPLLKQLKAEGDNLSKIYDECSTKMEKLGLSRLSSLGRSRAGGLTGLIDFGPISSVMSIVQTAQATAKPFILAVGANVGGSTGTTPSIEAPVTQDYTAEDCTNFSYIIPPLDPEEDPGDVSAGNCSKFEPLQVEYKKDENGNPILDSSGNLVEDPDYQYTPDCNNCKNYKGRI